MTITNMDTFLDRMTGKLGRGRRTTADRPDLSGAVHRRALADKTRAELIEIFKEQCFFIHTQVIETTPELLQQSLDDLIAGYGGGPVIRSGDERFERFGLQFPGADVWEEAAGREGNIRRSEAANVAVVFADWALAESGTIVAESGPSQGRALHFLPAHYIAVIEKERLLPRSTQVALALNRRIEDGEPVGSCINLISGPSNSADIEMQLVVGVHGPLRATYVLV